MLAKIKKIMSFKKIDKEFCLTDNSVNAYGYRLLTEGLDLSRFNPPIGYFMHKRELGVAVRWEDFRIENDKLYAKPVVNGSAFPNLASEIEGEFYLAASIGGIVALEINDDEALMLEGQTGPTVTRWYPREVSIVDIPANYNAVAVLYDENDCVLKDLTDNKINKNSKKSEMKKIEFTTEQLQLLNLSDNANDEQIGVALKNLADKAKRVDAVEKELQDLKTETTKTKVKEILEKGMSEHKLTKELADNLEKDYAGNSDALKKLVDSMTPQTRITNSKDEKTPTDLPEKFRGKSFNDLYVSGQLEELKADYPDYYETLKNKK